MAILDSINLFFQRHCRKHDGGIKDLELCCCKLSIVCRIQRRIQHLSYATCGWFALFFYNVPQGFFERMVEGKCKIWFNKG